MKDINAMTPIELLTHIRGIEARVETLIQPPKVRVITIIMKDDMDDHDTQSLVTKLKKWSTKDSIKDIFWGYKE